MNERTKPYTVQECADMLGLSRRVIAKLFEQERGTLIYESENKRRVRAKYRTLRIPIHVFERVKMRLSVR